MYAIAEDRNQQVTLRPGDSVLLDYNASWEPGSEVVLDKVCLLGGDAPQIGTPHVSGATVALEVVGHEKSRKIIVGKFKRRKNYKRKQGHRQLFTRVKVKEIRG